MAKHSVDKFGTWYKPLEWFLPLGLAALSAGMLGLILTGVFPLSAAAGMAQWLPAIYGSLEGFRAAAMLSISMGMVASFVFVLASGIVRAILQPEAERIARKGILAAERVEELEEKLVDSRIMVAQLETKLKDVNELMEENGALNQENIELTVHLKTLLASDNPNLAIAALKLELEIDKLKKPVPANILPMAKLKEKESSKLNKVEECKEHKDQKEEKEHVRVQRAGSPPL